MCAWGKDTRRIILERQNHCCSICGHLIAGNFVLHHRINRSRGGPTTVANGEARHSWCEAYAHLNFRFGNPNGVVEIKQEYTLSKKKARKLKKRSDRRPVNRYLLVASEEYAFRAYCEGKI